MIAWLLSAVAPIPLVLLARTFASLYVIPSESMLPTLQKGDVLLVAKSGLRRGSPPAVNELVVFNQPPALRALVGKDVKASDQFVKRVAGVGGDAPSFDARRVPAVCNAPSESLARAITDAARNFIECLTHRVFHHSEGKTNVGGCQHIDCKCTDPRP